MTDEPMRQATPEGPAELPAEPSYEPQADAPPPTLDAALPPDPDAYDSPRATQARARGLAAPYIAGGTDPDIEQTRRAERRYVRLLVAMIVIVIAAGFVLGIVAKLLGFDWLLGIP